MSDTIEIIPLERTRSSIRVFFEVARNLYPPDSHWVSPMLNDFTKMISNSNPLFEHAEMQLWIARKGGREAGRIACIIDRNHNQLHRENTAFFGFFESINDQATAGELFLALRKWADGKGMTRVRGPMNPTMNYECGLLVDAFESSPVIMMPYNPPFYEKLIVDCGFSRCKDLLAYEVNHSKVPVSRLKRIGQKVLERNPDIRIEPITKRNLPTHLKQIQKVYAESWEQNWGFVPMTEDEVLFLGKRLESVLTDGLPQIAFHKERPIAFLFLCLDSNEGLKPLRGRFCSPGIFRGLPYLLQLKTPRFLRLVAMGVIRQYRNRGIDAAMLSSAIDAGYELGFRHIEFSWILEDNEPIKKVLQGIHVKPYKTYRLFEREVGKVAK